MAEMKPSKEESWPPSLNGAKSLLEGSEEAIELRWKGLSDSELSDEINAYREGVRIICKELEERGTFVSLEDEESKNDAGPAGQAIPGVEVLHASLVPESLWSWTKKIKEHSQGEEGVHYHLGSIDDVDPSEWQVPPHCIPIHANVTTYNWKELYETTQFDVIMMDPPWQLATANPTRGVALGYSQLTDADIVNLPIPKLQTNGLLFIWVINAKYGFTLDLFERWGYTLVDEIVWVKMTVNRRMAKSHGYYLQHAKEVCLVAKKGADPPGIRHCTSSDIIYSERRGQSQKPEEIYQLVERLVPNGRYLEIFGRKNNLRNFWVTVGNEVTGTGLPKEDIDALKQRNCIPGAVYGAAGR